MVFSTFDASRQVPSLAQRTLESRGRPSSLFAVTLGFILSVWWTATARFDDRVSEAENIDAEFRELLMSFSDSLFDIINALNTLAAKGTETIRNRDGISSRGVCSSAAEPPAEIWGPHSGSRIRRHDISRRENRYLREDTRTGQSFHKGNAQRDRERIRIAPQPQHRQARRRLGTTATADPAQAARAVGGHRNRLKMAPAAACAIGQKIVAPSLRKSLPWKS